MRAEAAARDAVAARGRTAAPGAGTAVATVGWAPVVARAAAVAAPRFLLLALLGIAPIGQALLLGRVAVAPARRWRIAAAGQRRGSNQDQRDACRGFAGPVRHVGAMIAPRALPSGSRSEQAASVDYSAREEPDQRAILQPE